MISDKKSIRFHCQNIHLDSGELANGEVATARRAHGSFPGRKTSASIKLPEHGSSGSGPSRPPRPFPGVSYATNPKSMQSTDPPKSTTNRSSTISAKRIAAIQLDPAACPPSKAVSVSSEQWATSLGSGGAYHQRTQRAFTTSGV